MALKPDGVFLSNGPGDPAATGEYAVPVIRKVIDSGTPTFGICLGHQMLGIAVGGKTMKMHQGHHGANHPVKDLTTGKVEITSMNHGFAVDKDTLPKNVEQTHVSLFDGSNCGIALKDRPVFSVQYHPEASPGPRDSHYLFTRFVEHDAAGEAQERKATASGDARYSAMRVLHSRSPSCSRTTARCRTIRRCRCWSTSARSILPAARSGRRDRDDCSTPMAGATTNGATAFIRSCIIIRMIHEALGIARGTRESALRRRPRRSRRLRRPATWRCCRPAPAISGFGSDDLLVDRRLSARGHLQSLPRRQSGRARQGARQRFRRCRCRRAIRCSARTDRC